VAAGARRPELLHQIKRRMEAQPGITNVEVSSRTGSVLVMSDSDDLIDEALHEAFELVSAVETGEASEEAVRTLVTAVSEADRRIRTLTGGYVSLRWAVPAMFASAGVRQLFAQGLTLGNIPWYVLLYYGVDSFLKLYPEHSPSGPRGPGAV
jgi:Heavy metal associated domain 2